ncbi:chemotaxis protein CheX [Chitinilyticum litopenaei]|uniref:chemotaxis protein CheX n=1 Tax=Chitinilyticum litopenaei TaxID=1121276 RepID=UPI000401D1E8|nr:chemotaxis protein CheX [Chitinilyticum litopenaei]
MNATREWPGELVSKILVLDDSDADFERLRQLCEACGLVGIRPQRLDLAGVMSLLKSNVDLGGILLFEAYGGELASALALAGTIRKLRPELPLFLRRADAAVEALAGQDAALFRCQFTLADPEAFVASLESSIFSRIYPTEMVRALAEISRQALQALFAGCDIGVEPPYLVQDKLIYGEISTLISVDAGWCRGYLLLQTAEQELLALASRCASLPAEQANFRGLNNVLAEATNLIWGGFKNRFAQETEPGLPSLQSQVPIVINHERRYVSFGADDAHLCLRLTLNERDNPLARPVPVLLRLVFNLAWKPEAYRGQNPVDALVESGELELF